MWRETRKGSPDVLWVNESSPDLAETSFRELDDVFLQTQTRIWLGEVLHVRFDEHVKIAYLLADGELLFQVSKKVWKMLLRRHGELKHSKLHIYERTSSGKGDGRYMPYPKVDSFLKICQILGLTGIDLFSPSDVVEKRDIRRVCMCIRSLSKKARSKKLNVPDFDIVTYTIAMPTHFVGGIRRNLELSQFSPSSFSATSPWNDAREICGLKIPFGQHSLHSDSRSDESESSDLQFESPSSSASCDATNITYIVGETSPELSPVVDDFVHETSFNSSIEDSNNYQVVDEHQEEMFSESICSCHLSKMETSTLRNASSSSCSRRPSDQDTSICLSDIGKGSDDSIPKDDNNGLKAEDLAGTVDVETSYQASMNASSINVAPSEDNQHSQSSSPSIFSNLEVHSNLGVEPYNTRQKSSVFENAIAANNKAMKNRFLHMETSDDSNSVASKSYSVDPEADGNDGNLPSEIKSPSILDLNSLDNDACDSELEVPPSMKGRATDVADEESSVNPESCQYDDGKMRGFGHQMIKKKNSFYAKDLEVLDVMESSDFTYSDCASEMIPSFDFCRYALFRSDRNILKTEGETFLTVDILPGSTSDCREGGEFTSDGSIIVEKQVVSYIQAACAEPNNAPQAILDDTIFQKDTVMPDECGKWKDREGRTVGKTGNQVLKSVAGVMTMIGAFVLFLHVRQKKDREKKNETGMPFQIHKPNQEFFTKRRIKIGKSDSLYPGEKLKF